MELPGGDLAGQPLKNASNLAQCCGACLATSGCGAYSWEPAAGQCWLKSPKATGQWTATPDPKFTSAVVLWAPIQSERRQLPRWSRGRLRLVACRPAAHHLQGWIGLPGLTAWVPPAL